MFCWPRIPFIRPFVRSRVSVPVPPSISTSAIGFLLLSDLYPAPHTARTSSPAPAFSLAACPSVPENVSSPAPRSAVASLPMFAITVSLPAPVLRLFVIVAASVAAVVTFILRSILSLPAPALMLTAF